MVKLLEKYSKESLKKFVEYRSPTEETVFNLLVLHIVAYLIIFLISYTKFKCFLSLLPLCIISFVIYIAFKRINKPKTKIINLFCGLQSIILSFICQCGCYLFIPLTATYKLRLLLILVIGNLSILIFIVWFSANLVRLKKFPADIPISITIISTSVCCGISLSRLINSEMVMIFVLAAFSFIASTCSIYVLKYYYANILEKINNDKNTGDG